MAAESRYLRVVLVPISPSIWYAVSFIVKPSTCALSFNIYSGTGTVSK